MASTRRQQDREATQKVHDALEQEGFEAFAKTTATLRAVHLPDQRVVANAIPSSHWGISSGQTAESSPVPYKTVPEGAFRGAFATEGAAAAHGRFNVSILYCK